MWLKNANTLKIPRNTGPLKNLYSRILLPFKLKNSDFRKIQVRCLSSISSLPTLLLRWSQRSILMLKILWRLRIFSHWRICFKLLLWINNLTNFCSHRSNSLLTCNKPCVNSKCNRKCSKSRHKLYQQPSPHLDRQLNLKNQKPKKPVLQQNQLKTLQSRLN